MRSLIPFLGLALQSWLFGTAAAAEASDCSSTGCPMPRAQHDGFVHWSAPEHATPPPIDQKPASHLRVATFALG